MWRDLPLDIDNTPMLCRVFGAPIDVWPVPPAQRTAMFDVVDCLFQDLSIQFVGWQLLVATITLSESMMTWMYLPVG